MIPKYFYTYNNDFAGMGGRNQIVTIYLILEDIGLQSIPTHYAMDNISNLRAIPTQS